MALPFKRSTKDTLKEAVEARKEATRKEAEARAFVERLGSKLNGQLEALPDLKAAIETAEAERRRAVDLVALDEMSPEDQATKRDKVDKAKQALAEAEEMVQAVEAAKSRAGDDLSRAEHNTQAAVRAFWGEVFGHLKGKILDSVGEDIELAWAAFIASGQGRVLVNYLMRLLPEERFPRELPREKASEMLDRLDREYGG